MPHVKHTPGPSCPACELILDRVHPYMQEWYYRRKRAHPELHIASTGGYRDKAMQDAMVASGKSKDPWPKSKHNATKPDGTPCSYALDLFALNVMGNAVFPDSLYRSIWDESVAEKAEIFWGINFARFKDGVHFHWTGEPWPRVPI